MTELRIECGYTGYLPWCNIGYLANVFESLRWEIVKSFLHLLQDHDELPRFFSCQTNYLINHKGDIFNRRLLAVTLIVHIMYFSLLQLFLMQ
jgi:hypothetical protein